jgi:outer membrane receptor protein involved in Fe transport
VTSAIANSGPQPLGRPLSSGNITVNVIPRYTLYSARRNNIDFRVGKILRFGRTRTQVALDVYNLLNSDYVQTVNNTFVPNTPGWLTPLTVAPARYAKVNVQFDF